MKKIYHALGLMSGSSLDGLDVAFSRFEIKKEDNSFEITDWKLLAAATYSFSEDWRKRLKYLPVSDARELVAAHAAFGTYMGELVNRFSTEKKIAPNQIDLIASHGHTVFHEPEQGFTTQIGSGAALAAATGCKVIDDFRSADIAFGGQGAPLAPMVDKMLFPGYDFYLNLGGIANVTANTGGRFIAFDICGVNQILNALANEKGLPYDEGGAIAASGQPISDLLNRQRELPFFNAPYPKSLSNQWVQENQVRPFSDNTGTLEDRLFTACELTALLIDEATGMAIRKEGLNKEQYTLLVAGGGAYNDFLIARLRHYLGQRKVELIIPEKSVVDFKEALLMALLGVMRLEKVPNVLSSVTGASADAIGGAVWEIG